MTTDAIADLAFNLKTAYTKWLNEDRNQSDCWISMAKTMQASGYSDRHLTPEQRRAIEALRSLAVYRDSTTQINHAISAICQAFPRDSTPSDRPGIAPTKPKPQHAYRHGQPLEDPTPTPASAKQEMSIVHVTVRGKDIIALTEDGKLWKLDEAMHEWLQLPGIKVDI